MSSGCRRRRRLPLALALGVFVGVPALISAAPASRDAATAQLRLIVPAPEVRREIARYCRDEATVGYVPVVRVAAGTPGIPPDGRFVRCETGDAVFLVPAPP